ncbi:MAG: hypothetical protein JW862_15645 [Anaerolineales bacterium]|nr:hypothetical protein [Anaerolineales bacterium]
MAKDVFDYIDESEPVAPRRNRSAVAWNILTILVLLTAACLAVIFLTIFINPQSGFNPFPPPTLPVLVLTNTPTATPRVILPPTWTPTPSPVPSETPTPEPTATDLPPQPTSAGPVEGMPFVLHAGSPQYLPNFYRSNDCNWMGVAGFVYGLNDAPLQYVVLQLGGNLDGRNIDMLTSSGLASQIYGAGAYEFEIIKGEQPVASSQSLWLQLLDQQGLPLSNKIYFDTYADCDRNLVLISFQQVK